MNPQQLDDKEILAFIEHEFQEGELDAVCYAKAERESNGNDHLMKALYILKRLDVLKSERMVESVCVVSGHHAFDRTDVYGEVIGKGSTGALVRYRSGSDVANPRVARESLKGLRTVILGNFVLLLSSVSAVAAFMVLMGHTLYDLSYMIMLGLVLVLMVLPHLCSNLLVRRFHLSYQNCLALLCVCMCMGSMGLGVIVMKKNPQNYVVEMVEDKPVHSDKEEVEVNIILGDDESVVTN